jgi:predicted amidophosphoribosyltransferase
MTETEKEKWNENVETCSDCGIQWKKIGRSCPVCYAPAETNIKTKI